MKKIVAFCFFLLASLACGSYASAAQVDLQPNNVVVTDDGYLRLVIQNNGPDNFQGSFTITTYPSTSAYPIYVKFNGSIAFGDRAMIDLCKYVEGNTYSVCINSRGEVTETNEWNDWINFAKDEPRVEIISYGGLIANGFRDTIRVLPGEYFYEQFGLQEMNYSNDIIGFDFNFYSYRFGGHEDFDFWLWRPYGKDLEGESEGGTYKIVDDVFESGHEASITWMANSSASANNGLYIGSFSGTTKGFEVGEMMNISLYAKVALKNLTDVYKSVGRTIKVIDRIRCDVNDDGVVDKKDLDIMMDVVEYGRHNSCMYFNNMYQEKGMNYGAGIILFPTPDFVSNCLLNIWIHDKNDPLVQGLGIGEMMSAIDSQSAIERVANSFSVSDNELVIDAPEADIYNVTAQQADGKFFQATGKIGEKISIPDPSLNYRVETVRLNNPEMATKLFAPKVQDNQLISVRSTRFSDQINISGTGKLTIVNLSGQTLFTGNLDGNELNIPTSDWTTGMYIAKIISQDGHTQTTKLIK